MSPDTSGPGAPLRSAVVRGGSMSEPTAEPPGLGNADSALPPWLSMTEPTAEPPGLGNADSALPPWLSVGR